ncbi:hypothetical protein ACEWY4_023552 [Coilia grayii]|uniref:A-kinase anchor protein 17A n=1 Tax=Coilia grayii TaxID=363190 RepID=A0ABD1J4B2_9TELE
MNIIVHDTTEAVKLSPAHNLYLKPIAKMTINVGLPQLKLPGKSISNWEVMERLKAMVHPDQFSSLRISKSTMDFIRFEGEVENKGVVKSLLAKLDGKSIKLSGFTDILKVRAAENKVDFPTRHDWDSFFRDAKDMNETVPGERPDTIHLEGLPCKWFASKDGPLDKPSESVLKTVFESFGKIRNVDIPMLDPYREEMTDKNFNTFTFGGHLNFEAYVQYQEYIGFVKAMDTLRGMKLMYKGEDGKAIACNVKVNFDTTKHLSDSAMKRRQLERQKLQELERQREEQKRKEKEEEGRRKEEERRQREQEEEEKERKKEEKLRKREQKLREREEKRNQKRVKKQQEEEQRRLQLKIATEERKLLLAQRNLESIRLMAELLSRVKALRQQQLEREREEEARRRQEEQARLQQLEERRRQQEAELRRVEGEKARALELQRKERELRERLLGNLLKKSTGTGAQEGEGEGEEDARGGSLGLELIVRDPTLEVQLECATYEARAQVNGVGHGGKGAVAGTGPGRQLSEGLSRQRKRDRGDQALAQRPKQGQELRQARSRGGDGCGHHQRSRRHSRSRRGESARRSPSGREGGSRRRRSNRRRSESHHWHARSHSRSRAHRRSRRSWSSSGRSSRSSRRSRAHSYSRSRSHSHGRGHDRGRSLSRSSSSSRERRDHRHHSRSTDKYHSRHH